MKNPFVNIIFIILFSLISNRLVGQFPIPDPNFKAFLKTKYPSVINSDQTLNISAANAVTGNFHCYNQNISDLSGIEYFINITSLEVKYNPNLQSLPNISPLTKIAILGLDSNGLTSLPDLSSLTNLQILSFHHNQLSVVPDISKLTKISFLLMDNNNLTSLPDLSKLVNLQELHCSDNPLVSLPSFSTLTKLNLFLCQRTNISSIPDLSNCTALQYFICTNNNVTSLPDLSNCPLLKELKVFNCKLNSFPNLSSFSNLTAVNANNNELSFEDILPSSAHPSFTSVFLFNGQKPGVIQNLSVKNKYGCSLLLGYDNAVASNSYSWYKDGVFVTTTTQNKLDIPSAEFSDAGVYTCTITNTGSSLAGITINSKFITLSVTPCVVASKIKYAINSIDCSYPIKMTIDETSFVGSAPFVYTLKNEHDSLEFRSTNFTLSKEGIYNLSVKDFNSCEVQFDSAIVVPRNEKCDPVFYPNGDGIADTYFIENTGQAKIYGKNGQLVKELIVPGSWDGTDSKGQELPSGLYVIIIGNNTIRITILR